jgi:hypothetical protein
VLLAAAVAEHMEEALVEMVDVEVVRVLPMAHQALEVREALVETEVLLFKILLVRLREEVVEVWEGMDQMPLHKLLEMVDQVLATHSEEAHIVSQEEVAVEQDQLLQGLQQMAVEQGVYIMVQSMVHLER